MGEKTLNEGRELSDSESTIEVENSLSVDPTNSETAAKEKVCTESLPQHAHPEPIDEASSVRPEGEIKTQNADNVLTPLPKMGGKTVWTVKSEQSDDIEQVDSIESSSDFSVEANGPMLGGKTIIATWTGSPVSEPEVPLDWDDTGDGVRGETAEHIDMPSTDIRGDFERVLDGPLDFHGSFYFNKTYAEYPNPILRVGSLGHIGLPLSNREAKHVIAHCIQAPFGKGERTIVDKDVRDTWEMDSSQIHFENPAWNDFMSRVTREVCLQLGLAAGQASTVRCEPYKLLLYETGSHFLPHQDTEKAPNMFATVVVVLPSPFQGGVAQLSHGDLSAVIDSSPDSLKSVSVLAWYTDVMHEIKPITSGYRLAIAYNLIQTSSLRPMLPQTDGIFSKLRHVMLSWKQRTDAKTPVKLVYLLKHRYSLASLRGDQCLKGPDAYKLAVLQVVAKQLNFHLGLANVECHVVGSGDDDFGHRHRRGWGYDDSDETDADVGMAEVFEQTMTIEHLVGLDGGLILNELECDEDDTEFCPVDLRDQVEAGDPDEREYEGYQGNGAGSLELWYRRTVLVIWSNRHHAEIAYGDDPSIPLNILKAAKRPDEESVPLVRFLLRGIASKTFGHDAVRGLCRTACHWSDLSLWLKTVNLCDTTQLLDVLSTRRVLDAIGVFGFDPRLQDVVNKVLAETPRNTARIQLLDGFLASTNPGVETSWIARARYQVMKNLRKPIIGEEHLLVQLSIEGGGVPFLQNTILPQVLSTADASFFVAFAVQLVSEKSLVATDEHESVIKHVVLDLLQLALHRTDFSFAVSPNSDLAYSYIEACVKIDHPELAECVVDKLLETISNVSVQVAQTQALRVLLPLVLRLRAVDLPSLRLAKLCRIGVQCYTEGMGNKVPTDTEVSLILAAVAIAKDSSILLDIVLPRLMALPPSEALCRSFIRHLKSYETSISFDSSSGVSVSTINTQLLQNMVQKTHYGLSQPLLISHLELCLSTDNYPLWTDILPRLLSPSLTNKKYIEETLLPLVPKIQAQLASWKIPPTSEPFRTGFKQIFELYASKVLGLKVTDEASLVQGVRKLTCPCTECMAIVKFFLHSSDRELRLTRIGAPQRKHAEKQLAQYCGYRLASWATISTTPQGLEVTKSNLLYSAILWRSHQSKLKAAVDAISRDEGVIRNIFGEEDYKKFITSLSGASSDPEVGPPAKKRRVESSTQEIIDLCSP